MSFEVKNFFAFLYKTIVDIIIYSLILSIILAILPNSLFKNFPLEPRSYKLNFPDKVEKWNDLLNSKSELLLNGKLIGPESLADNNGFIYTGLSDGRVVELNKKTLKIRDVAKFGVGPICGTLLFHLFISRLIVFIFIIFSISSKEEPSECGRVLGVRFHRDGLLYALDFYNGLFRINVSTGQKERMPMQDIDKFGFDDLEFDPKLNVVYISILSTKWPLDRVVHGLLDYDDSGYIFAYNLDTKTNVKIRSGINLPNGLQLTKDKKHLLMAETQGFRISKTSIQSIHKAIHENRLLKDNEIETFAELPGEPDNIRLDPNGDILVSMFVVRKNGKIITDYLSEWPFVRKAIGRTLYSFGTAIDFVNIFGIKSLKIISNELITGEILSGYIPKNGGVIRLDSKSGEIKQILGSELFFGVTEALVDSEGDLYFGSFFSPFLGRIKRGNY